MVLVPLAGTSVRSERRHRAAWKKLGPYERRPGRPAENLHWSAGNAEAEARELVKFMRRNNSTVQQMVDWIGVSDKEHDELQLWADNELALAGKIDSMLIFRDQVLKEFLKLQTASS
jgi:hypothetical protein